MPCATTLAWQLVAIGIKFRKIGITSSVAPVPYLLWRQRRAESLPAFRLAPRVPDDLTPSDGTTSGGCLDHPKAVQSHRRGGARGQRGDRHRRTGPAANPAPRGSAAPGVTVGVAQQIATRSDTRYCLTFVAADKVPMAVMMAC